MLPSGLEVPRKMEPRYFEVGPMLTPQDPKRGNIKRVQSDPYGVMEWIDGNDETVPVVYISFGTVAELRQPQVLPNYRNDAVTMHVPETLGLRLKSDYATAMCFFSPRSASPMTSVWRLKNVEIISPAAFDRPLPFPARIKGGANLRGAVEGGGGAGAMVTCLSCTPVPTKRSSR